MAKGCGFRLGLAVAGVLALGECPANAKEWTATVSRPRAAPLVAQARRMEVAAPMKTRKAEAEASAAATRPTADAAAAVASPDATRADPQTVAKADPQQSAPAPAPVSADEAGEPVAAVKQYCTIVMDQAVKLRLDAEKAEALRLREQVTLKVEELEKAIARHAHWIAQREAFQARAHDALVRIYATMPAEAAAGRLAAMDELVAAAIVSKLAPKVAGALLGEMEQTKAARLSTYIAGAAEVKLQPAKSQPKGAAP